MTTATVTVDIGDLITLSSDVRGGRARVTGTGVTVHRIVGWYRLLSYLKFYKFLLDIHRNNSGGSRYRGPACRSEAKIPLSGPN